MIEIKDLSCGYKHKTIIKNFSIEASKGEILCLLGPNGIGKTTLFKTIIGFLKPLSGEIFIDGKNINNLNDKQRASIIGYVPQSHIPPFPFRVLDVVLMGRTPKLDMFESPSKKDEEISKEALNKLKISHLTYRIYTELSGGERQMVLIARALASQTSMLILDEPTSNLDFGNQVRVLEHINKLADEGLCIIMTSHYPEHVFQTNCKVALIQNKDTIIKGSAKEVITAQNLHDTYNIDVEIADIVLKNKKTISSCIPIIN
ncbi:MAG: ABC transporter ATP-binding protein [Campylobacteraceae bacterium]